MKNLRISLFICYIAGIYIPATGNDLTQTIKGQVTDKQSKQPVPFANVVVLETDPILGTVANFDGYFKIEKVPVGRIAVKISFLGYEPVTIGNLDLNTGKEMILFIELEENVVKMKDVVIRAHRDKSKTINRMSSVSARMFSVEESERYAGSFNDVSRMAQNFAGVRAANDAVNDIVIRGNSPFGLLWRMEGIDIPNPNHFGDGGATGGPVSMLNNNVLANSDFMTGAFPAEYGNALSGVFDLKMRNGNYDKHEFLGQIGFNGFEFGAEGPVSKKKRASYMINYRYSTLSVLTAMGINFGTGTAIPEYQDLSFKLNFPSRKMGSISIFGLGGFNYIEFLDSERDTSEEKAKQFYTPNETDITSISKLGVIGISHTLLLDSTAYSKLTISGSATNNRAFMDSLSTIDRSKFPFWRQSYIRQKYTASFFMNKKMNSQNSVRIGVFADLKLMDLADSSYNGSYHRFVKNIDYGGSAVLYQPYAQWQFRLNHRITFNTGLHFLYLALNNRHNIEPRLGIKWKFTPRQTFSIGYGLHSQTLPLFILQSEKYNQNGSYTKHNQNLDFTKSHHFIVGYDLELSETVRMKLEMYYQSIYDAAIEEDSSSFSSLNFGSFSYEIPKKLVNGGTGYNYGFEMTLEKFMDKGFYFLSTLSLFESKYKGSDGIKRNTVFNGSYVYNLLAGKEFELKSKKSAQKSKNAIIFDARFNYAGGQRYTPLDKVKSNAAGRTVLAKDLAFSEQLDPYIRLDIQAGYKLIGKKATQVWSFSINNVLNHKNPLNHNYNADTGEIEIVYQTGFFPMLFYRITF